MHRKTATELATGVPKFGAKILNHLKTIKGHVLSGFKTITSGGLTGGIWQAKMYSESLMSFLQLHSNRDILTLFEISSVTYYRTQGLPFQLVRMTF